MYVYVYTYMYESAWIYVYIRMYACNPNGKLRVNECTICNTCIDIHVPRVV